MHISKKNLLIRAWYWKSENVPGASVQLKAFYFYKNAVFIIILETKAICLAYIFLKGTFTKYIFITWPFTSGSRKRCLDFMLNYFFFWTFYRVPTKDVVLHSVPFSYCVFLKQYFFLRYTRLAQNSWKLFW